MTHLISEAIVSSNSFAQKNGTFVANLLALADCTFMGKPKNSEKAGIFVADRATVVGNIGVRVNEDFILIVFTHTGYTLRDANSIFILPAS